MSSVTQIADDIFVLTDLDPLDGNSAWLPPHLRGYEPHNKFLVMSGDAAVLIDTGVAAHGASLLESLVPLLGGRRLVVLSTRNELDCIGNLALIVDHIENLQVVTCNALPSIGLVHPTRPVPGMRATRLVQGKTLADLGFARLRAVPPLIRVLGTSWIYDDATRTLFPSDFFGADVLVDSTVPIIRRDSRGLPTVDAIREIVIAKFDWLTRARTEEIAANWDVFFAATHPVAIAPAHGRILLGRDLVLRTIADYRTAVFGAATALAAGAA
jgi:flavorubredoxin